MRGKPLEYRKALGEIVCRAMIDLINVPNDDKFRSSPNTRLKS
jgi:4-oxalocrotonate tautomerase